VLGRPKPVRARKAAPGRTATAARHWRFRRTAAFDVGR